MTMALTDEELAAIASHIVAALELRLNNVKSELGSQVSDLADRTTRRLEHRVNVIGPVIEPIGPRAVLYKKPKGFFTIPVYEPGYGMRRGKSGYQG